MASTADYLAAMNAPANRPHETLDVTDLPPPKPLTETLELLAELDDRTTLVQFNDRAPQFLYPKLEDRGYVYDTAEVGGQIVTAIWQP